MSGVYIKGMEMPHGCAFCKIKRRNGGKMVCPLCNEEWDIRDPMSADFRMDLCPLTPVPPHGRLIDADALMKMRGMENDCYNCPNGSHGWCTRSQDAANICEAIEDAPTIIPAEEDKDG